MIASSKLTHDTFLNGRLKVYQNKTGYRFSIDAILLAGFMRPRRGDRLIDLGCGCGIIALILAFRYETIRAIGIDIQSTLVELARKNVQANQMTERIRILQMNLKDLSSAMTGGQADMVVCNPPFGRIHSGRINPNDEHALARHEIALTLSDITAVVRRTLRTRGRFGIVFPVERIADLFDQMRLRRIEPKRMRLVQSTSFDSPHRILVEGIANGQPGMTVEPPLVIYQSKGEYTEEVRRLMA